MRRANDPVRPPNHRENNRRDTPQNKPNTNPKCDRRYILSIWGNPSSGTFDFILDAGSMTPATVTLHWNDDAAEIETALNAAVTWTGPITCEGGPLPNNDIVITIPRGKAIAVGDSTDLEQNGGFVPHARLDTCCGAT